MTPITEERLRETLESLAEQVVISPDAYERAQAEWRRRERRRRIRVVVIAIVIVAIADAIGLWALNQARSGSPVRKLSSATTRHGRSPASRFHVARTSSTKPPRKPPAPVRRSVVPPSGRSSSWRSAATFRASLRNDRRDARHPVVACHRPSRTFHGATPVCQRLSRRRTSRSVSMQCQKSSWR